jgi:hypothetical protein
MYLVIHVKCPLFLSDFNQKRNVSKKILVKTPNIKFHKNLSREINPDTRSKTDSLKLSVAFCMRTRLKMDSNKSRNPYRNNSVYSFPQSLREPFKISNFDLDFMKSRSHVTFQKQNYMQPATCSDSFKYQIPSKSAE